MIIDPTPQKNKLGFILFVFWVGLLSVVLDALLIYYINIPFNFYYLYYILLVVVAIITLLSKERLKLIGISRNIMLLIIYSIIITAPLTLINGNIIAYLIFIKNTFITFIIFFYLQIKINSLEKVKVYIHSIIKGGILFSIYIGFEFINKIFELIPSFNKILRYYYSISRNTAMAGFADLDQMSQLGIIRPLGLEINFTAGAFFLSSVFFIVLISGERFFKKSTSKTLALVLLYLGTVITSSRQIIYSMHILLFVFVTLYNTQLAPPSI